MPRRRQVSKDVRTPRSHNAPICTEQYDAIRPLSIGVIVDRSVTVAVRRWRTLFALALIEAVPVGLVRTVLPERGGVHLLWLPLDIALVALLYPAAVLTAAATTTPALAMVLQGAARRYGASLITFLISAAWILLWLIVPSIAGTLALLMFSAFGSPTVAVVAAAVAAGVVALLVLPRAGLVAATMLPIVILERRSPSDAFTRARRRVDHSGFVRSSLLGLALFAVTVAPTLVVGYGIDALMLVTHISALQGLEELISDVLSMGLGIVLGTVAALDLRARYEGADLEAELGGAVTS